MFGPVFATIRIQEAAPIGKRAVTNTFLPNLHGEHRPEPIPPETRRLVPDVDAAIHQGVFGLTA